MQPNEEWMVINSADARGKLKKIKFAIVEIENNAEKCCSEIIPFSFRRFEYNFFDKKIEFQNVESAFTAYIQQLRNNNQLGTADSYRTAMSALNKYKSNLRFDDVSPKFLQGF